LVSLFLPAAVPPAAAEAKAESAAVDVAILDLKREYAASLKTPDTAPLRPQCTYFLDHPPASPLSPEAVVAALDKPVGNDPRVAAYVRWQLLSAAPKKFESDPKLLPLLLEAYRRAPAPPPRLGLSPQDQAKLDALLTRARKEDDATLSAKLEEQSTKDAEAGKPILAYRDELYARLPTTYETLLAGFEDAHDRTLAAAGGGTQDAHAAQVVKDAQAWAQSGQADPKQCGQLAELVAKLRHVRSPPYYARATLRRGADRLSWATKTDSVYSPKKLADLEKVLRDAEKLGRAQKAAEKAAQKSAPQKSALQRPVPAQKQRKP
jgi:hypothetical protein